MNTKKISRILVPTDYSPNAKRALHYALELAKNLEAEIQNNKLKK